MSIEVDSSPTTADDQPLVGPPETDPRSRVRRVADALWAPRHLPFAILFVAAVVLRFLAWRAYSPALLLFDSKAYLAEAHHFAFGYYQPSGYPLFLKPLLWAHWGPLIPLVQHLLALAMALGIYLMLQRWRVPAWGAALATIPLLFDPMQIIIEQYVLSDTLFESLLIAACLLLLWRRRPGSVALGLAGLCVGFATITRSAGMLLVVAVLLAAIGLHVRWRAVAALLVGFAIPVAGYVVGHHASNGHYSITDAGSRFMYGRIASIVDCPSLKLPGYERALCPVEPLHHRRSIDYYMWYVHYSPQFLAPVPAGMTREQMLRDFDKRVITQEPLAYLRLVADDLSHWAQPGRTPQGPTDFRLTDFQFKPYFPTRVVAPYMPEMLRELYADRAQGRPGDARVLMHLQNWYYTPGSVLAACAFLVLLAVFGVGRAKRSGLRSAGWLFGGQALIIVLTTSMASGFGWRYQLPEFVLLPAAGALGLTALLRRPVTQPAEEHHPSLAVERLANGLIAAQRPLPARLQVATEANQALKLVRYALGSVICSVVSGGTFAILFGFAQVGSRTSSLAASATGALAGYWLNRAWTWERRHRADWRREMLPYWATIIGSAIAAALVTGGVNALVLDTHISRGLRTVIDLAAYFATYAASFIVKYVVFDRLFAGERPHAEVEAAPAEV